MRTTINDIRQMKQSGEKIVMLTAYDYSTAKKEDYYVIFFKDDGVMSHEWFTAYYANFIHQALGILPSAAQ